MHQQCLQLSESPGQLEGSGTGFPGQLKESGFPGQPDFLVKKGSGFPGQPKWSGYPGQPKGSGFSGKLKGSQSTNPPCHHLLHYK